MRSHVSISAPMRRACGATRTACMVALSLAALAAASVRASADVRLFRPLSADPRENQSSWRLTSYTTDWRYGTDIEDSTSHGGVDEDVTGVGWDIAAGETFRWRPLEHLLGWRGPWRCYQLGATGGTFVTFDNTGSLLNADYQFGAVLDMAWTGAFDDDGLAGYDRPVVTSRVGVAHHSSHLGDEYLTYSRFGRNRAGLGALSNHPPVKRVELSYEAMDAIVAVEWAPRGAPDATVRAYAGGEFKLVFPGRWEVGGLKPVAFDAPAARFGLEWRGQGNRTDPMPGPIGTFVGRLLRDETIAGELIAAVDLRLARPFNFARCDNPDDHGEVWTPHLATDCLYGRPYAHYAGSWHGRMGVALSRRGDDATPRLAGPEWLVTLDWYRGYSPNGQFLDQRLRYRPRWYVLPAVTVHF